jgi:SAM-dependent methyltransferase
MPLAGGFVSKLNIKKKEIKVPLKVYFCENCLLLQVKDSVSHKILFKNYKYSSSTIPSLNKHFKDYSNKIKNKFLKQQSVRLLEFGANDGVLLSNFKKDKNFFCLGVDPAKNIAKLGKIKNLNYFVGLFNENNALKIKKKFGKFDYITGSNVFAHIDDIHSVVEASKTLLKKDGNFVTEVHYLPNLINLNQYDFIYHEHLNYYTLTSLIKLFDMHGMNLYNFEKIKTHGGSIRVYVSLDTKKKKSKNLIQIIKTEKKINISYFKRFIKNSLIQRDCLKRLLVDLRNKKKLVFGFGASGRGTILVNFCKIDKSLVKYIIDESPLRSGKYMPGVKIPIKNLNFLLQQNKKIDYMLIIAWNYSSSIIKKIKMINKKIKFVLPFPFPKII